MLPQAEPEREIFPLKRPPKKVRVSFFDMITECFRGKGYVEVEVPDEEAFGPVEKDFETINLKEEDI
tara:strand:+ start:180 stop:380 length:201 start_codon:yes stop_codon:yes gene_type:complete